MALIVKSETAKLVRQDGLRASSSLFDALDEKVKLILASAAKRAKANGRSTILPQDL